MRSTLLKWLSSLSLAVLLAVPAQAETVIKLDFGTDSAADLQLSGGVFSTVNNLNASTTGNQDTNVLVLDFLDPFQADITDGTASVSLSSVNTVGPVTMLGTTVFQPTMGGSFQIYNSANVLLLSGTLQDGVISGPIGSSRTGSFLTAVFGAFTGGTLAPHVDPNSASLAISLTGVRSAGNLNGLQVSNNVLLDFTADATANIGALVPEPATGSLALLNLGAVFCSVRRRR